MLFGNLFRTWTHVRSRRKRPLMTPGAVARLSAAAVARAATGLAAGCATQRSMAAPMVGRVHTSAKFSVQYKLCTDMYHINLSAMALLPSYSATPHSCGQRQGCIPSDNSQAGSATTSGAANANSCRP